MSDRTCVSAVGMSHWNLPRFSIPQCWLQSMGKIRQANGVRLIYENAKRTGFTNLLIVIGRN